MYFREYFLDPRPSAQVPAPCFGSLGSERPCAAFLRVQTRLLPASAPRRVVAALRALTRPRQASSGNVNRVLGACVR